MPDTLLINVPLSSPLHPKANMPFLAGYLKQHGFQVKFLDANLAFFKWLLGENSFDFSDPDLKKNPVQLLSLYSKIEACLLEKTQAFPGFSADLRTISYKYNRNRFTEVEKALNDSSANPGIEFFSHYIDNEILPLGDISIIGIGITFQDNIIAAFTLAKLLREKVPNAKIVLGGQMITRSYDNLTKCSFLSQYYDYLALWDGELPLLDLHNYLIKKEDITLRNIIPATDKVKFEIGRELAAFDLNETVHPDFADVKYDEYLFNHMLVPLQTARGCYGTCEFCAIPKGSNQGFRERGVDKIIADIEYVQQLTEKKFGSKATYFKFMDDTSAPKTLLDIAREIIDRNLDVKWETYARMEKPFANVENMKTLYKGGCRKLMWGLESNNPEILKNMNKKVKAVSTKIILNSAADAGILNFVFVLLGFPGETQEQRDALIDFIVENDSIHVLTVATFDVTRHSAIQNSINKGNPWGLECEEAFDFDVRLPYTLHGENWKQFIVAEAQKFMIEISKRRPDIALVSLFPDQVRGALTELHGNQWGKLFLKDFGEDNLKQMLNAAESYADAFASGHEVELSYLPDPIKREHFRTSEDIDAINEAIKRRKKYESRRNDSI